MIVLSFDPSSTCTGWALMKDGESTKIPSLINCGKIRSKENHSFVQKLRFMRQNVFEVISSGGRTKYPFDITHILIEVPLLRQHTTVLRTGRRSSLAKWGFGCGVVYATCLDMADVLGCECLCIDNSWTRSFKLAERDREKMGRRRFCDRYYKHLYAMEKDRGGDVADAICMGMSFILNMIPALAIPEYNADEAFPGTIAFSLELREQALSMKRTRRILSRITDSESRGEDDGKGNEGSESKDDGTGEETGEE